MNLMKYVRIICLVVMILFLDVYYCYTAHASALPTPPPTLQLVEPELKVIKGNAYQYALEKLGYDVQYGVNALEVWAAVEAACKGIDYAFQDVNDYEATIQHVQDTSGLPSNWQGINMEIYFAKIDYLDMQIGIYLDETGKSLGKAMVQYKQGAQEMLERCVTNIKNNVLGKIDMAEYNFDTSIISQEGLTYGGIGTFVSDYYARSYTTDKYKVSRCEIIKSYPENQFFTVRASGVDGIYCIGLPDRVPKIKVVDSQFSTQSNLANVLRGGTTYDMFYRYNVHGSGASGIVLNNGYCLYYFSYMTSRGNPYNMVEQHYSPFPSVNMEENDFANWFKNQYVINLEPGKLVRGAINLNPNSNPQGMPQPDELYDYDAITGHNEGVSETVPTPNPNPGLKPLPNVPQYPPVSPTLPELEPLPYPMPDYQPVPNPEPEPNPDPDQKPDPDLGLIAPISGLTDKFPFCVPFDLIDAFKSLAAESEVPKWEVTIAIPNTKYSADIVIDLAPFNNVAKLSRILILLMFIIVLIVATRRLISN